VRDLPPARPAKPATTGWITGEMLCVRCWVEAPAGGPWGVADVVFDGQTLCLAHLQDRYPRQGQEGTPEPAPMPSLETEREARIIQHGGGTPP
jgi:hypothetical protein